MTSFPVIPASVPTLDNTMMSDFNKCNWWYWLRHTLGLRPKGDSAALAFGAALHDGLAVWYRTKDRLAALDKVDAIDYPSIPGDYRTKGLVFATLEKYWDHYGNDDQWDVILNETSFSIEDEDGFRWGGRLDLGVRWHSGVWIVDHKSTSIGGPTWWTEFETSPQMAGYTYAASLLRGNEAPKGVIINRLVVRSGGTFDFERRPFRWPAWKIEEWKADRVRNYHELSRCITDDNFPRNRYSCVGRYGKCPAFDVCNAPPSARPRLIEFDFIEDRWDWSK